MEQKPTHIEDPLTTLKETLVNAISTIDRLQCDNNPVLERYDSTHLGNGIYAISENDKTKIVVDSWCVQVTKENREVLSHYFKSSCLYNSDNQWSFHVNKYYGVDKDGEFHWCDYTHPTLGIYEKVLTTEEFYNKIGYIKPTENILEKGKEVLQSQGIKSEIDEFKEQWIEAEMKKCGEIKNSIFFKIELNTYKEKVNKIRAEFNQRLDEIFLA